MQKDNIHKRKIRKDERKQLPENKYAKSIYAKRETTR